MKPNVSAHGNQLANRNFYIPGLKVARVVVPYTVWVRITASLNLVGLPAHVRCFSLSFK